MTICFIEALLQRGPTSTQSYFNATCGILVYLRHLFEVFPKESVRKVRSFWTVGWDLHRLEDGKRLVIGGVDVPHTKGTIAHSDGTAFIFSMTEC